MRAGCEGCGQLVRGSEAEIEAALTRYRANAASAGQRTGIAGVDALWPTMRASLNALVFREAPPAGMKVAASVADFNALSAKLTANVKVVAGIEEQRANQAAASGTAAYRAARAPRSGRSSR